MPEQKFPPGPKSKFFGVDIGMQFSKDPLNFAEQMIATYGDVTHLRLGPSHYYLVNHPDLVHFVLVKGAKSFNKWDRQKRVFGKFNGNGIVNTDGDFWRRQRKMMQPAFHHQRISAYADDMVSIANDHISTWDSASTVNFSGNLANITRDIVSKTLFGADVSEDTEKIGEAMGIIQEMAFREFSEIVHVPDWLPLPSKRRERDAIQFMDTLIHGIIEQRRKTDEDAGDLLSMLLLAEDENGERMSAQQARDEAMTLFIAGYETTATALSWAFYRIAAHSEVQECLMAEIDALNGATPTMHDLARLPYTEQVVKETLRLYPSTWSFPRQANEDVQLGEYTVPKDSIITLYPYLLHRDPRFFDDPEAFQPERFAPENEGNIPKYAYYPFGGGARVCIGNAFAMMEMRLIIATVLQRYRLSVPAGRGEPNMLPLVTLIPEGGVHLNVAPRQSQPMPETQSQPQTVS